VRKPGLKINLFVAKQICACDSQAGCCAAPGQSKKEIAGLTGALKKITQVDTKINDIRDIKTADEFPKAAALFKKYGYNCLPIVMVDEEIVTYGIPDEEFIVNSIKKVKPR
jgi:hypothetical protein